MSKSTHDTSADQKHEHGTYVSYVIGFLLSLELTLIPYFLVTKQVIVGNVLLASILILAMLQLIVQVIFFLHLGRGPKPNWNLFFFLSTIGIIFVVVGGSILIISNLRYNMHTTDQVKKLVNDEGIYQIKGEVTGACQGQHVNHIVTIENNQANPSYTYASKCDTLTFINEDSTTRKITFGEHDEHESYAGETELIVRKGKNKTITLSEPGTYKFHDHLNDQINGNFTVLQ